jgi:hypothetical protein
MWLVESPTWAAHAEVNAQIIQLGCGGVTELPFVYLSDAEKGHSVSPAYREAHLARSKRIGEFYDPELV